jgi:charged multivesicular body protein 4
MRLFGKKKEPKMNQEQVLRSMESLRKTIDDIGKRSQVLQNKASNEMKDALVRKKQGDKSGALICLKRKKLYEGEIAKLEGARMNLEQQLFAIEGASMNKNIFDSLKTGNQVLKQVHGDMKIEDVDKLKDEMEEQQEMLNELNEAISQPIGSLSNLDDDELMNELDELEAKEYEIGMLDLGAPGKVTNNTTVTNNVAAPQPVKKNDDLDDLYNELQF